MTQLFDRLVRARATLGAAALVFGGLSGVAVAPAAMAAEQPASPPTRSNAIEEVIVTARMVEESVQDVPIAITALSAEQLSSPTIRNITDLNGYSPNVTIDQNGSRGGRGAVIGIRGISPTRTDDNSFDAPVGVMIDNIYLGTLAGQVIENFDLERIEILRGPQGTLFGKNTVGGVLRVFRSRPTGELGGRVRLTYGDNNQQEVQFIGNAPLVEDRLALKVFATTQQADGFTDNVTIGGHVGDVDYKNYGGTLLFTPTEGFEALLTVENFDDKSELQAFQTNGNFATGVTPDFPGGFLNCTVFNPTIACRNSTSIPGVAENNTDNNAKLDTNAYTLNMTMDLSDRAQLVSITGYRTQNEYRIFDFDGSAAPFITIERWNDYNQFSQEFRIDSQWDNLKMTSGVYFWNNEFTQDWSTGGRFWATLFGAVAYNPAAWGACQNFKTNPFAPINCDTGITPNVTPGADVTQILYEKQETTSTAVYSQVDWTFATDWTLTAGARWTTESKDFQAGQSYLSNVERQRLRNFPEYSNLDNTWNDVSPRLGLSYQLDQSSLVYASFNRGFHSGGFFGVNQNTRDFVRDQYKPETGNAYEIGYKSTHLEDRLLLNITLFRNDFEDKQESFVGLDPDTKTVKSQFANVADATYQGVELETQYVFADWFRAFVNYGYLDSEYSSFDFDTNNDGIEEDVSDLTPRNAPENTVGVGGTFSWPIGPGLLELYGKYAWIDEIEGDLLNSPLGQLDSRKNVTASLGWTGDKWSVIAAGQNLTDEEQEGITPIANLFAVGSLNYPRTWSVAVTYNFE